MTDRIILDKATASSGATGIIAWLRGLLRSCLRPSGARARGAARWYDDTSASRGL